MQLHPLSDAALLDVWEAGQPRPPLERAVLVLEAVCPDVGRDELLAMRIGERDRCLLIARAATFGRRLQGLIDCPACRETVEFDADALEMAARDRPNVSDTLSIDRDGYVVSFRLPDTQDLAAIASRTSPDPAGQLLQRCVLSAAHAGTPCAAGQLPQTVIAAVEEEMARADPYADLRMALECPACAHQWTIDFDIASFMWRELHTRAVSLLRDVHALASAYGWHERDILDMGAARRSIYLDLVGA